MGNKIVSNYCYCIKTCNVVGFILTKHNSPKLQEVKILCGYSWPKKYTSSKTNKTNSPCIVAIFVCSFHVVLYTLLNLFKLFLNIANFNITCSGNSVEMLESPRKSRWLSNLTGFMICARLHDFLKAVCAKCPSWYTCDLDKEVESAYIPKFVSVTGLSISIGVPSLPPSPKVTTSELLWPCIMIKYERILMSP